MERKNKKTSVQKTVIIIIAAFVVLLAAFLLLSQTKSQQAAQANDSSGGKETIKAENTTTTCLLSSTGINLCDLPLEQRQKQELMDQLNLELAAKQNATTDSSQSATQIKKIAGDITASSSVRLKVAIPGYDHASLVGEDLKNLYGVADVYWSPPDLFDVKYDSSKTSVRDILSRDIFKKYNASVVSSA
jgi:copper chaperone CopZ